MAGEPAPFAPAKLDYEPERQAYATPHGEAWAWTHPGALEREGPLVLTIQGVFAIARPRDFELQGHMPEAVVLNAHLPGNHCPRPSRHDIETYAAMYDSVLDQIGRPAIVMGSSTGALVALAMRSPRLRGLVLMEPPLLTAKLWPLIAPFRKQLRANPRDVVLRQMMWNIFGYNERGVTGRDYRPLLQALDRPSWALWGSEPLMPERPFTSMPSLVDEPERDLMRAHPCISTFEVEGCGHNVPARGMLFARTRARDLIARTIAAGEAA